MQSHRGGASAVLVTDIGFFNEVSMKFLALILSLVSLAVASDGALPGKQAPAFSLADAQGKTVTLAELAGKVVVLEWVNFDCPFVRKHYGSGNMQALQKEAKAKGVVWISVGSSAKGKQGWFEGEALKSRMAKEGWAGAHYLVDADGKMGRDYGARTTPHLFVIASDGKVAYAGAIDDRPTADPEDVKGASNYVRAAWEALAAAKPVSPSAVKAYGCSVKY